MKNKIIAFGASNSTQSINKQLAEFAATRVKNGDVEVLDLNDFEMPIYSLEREKKSGIPEEAYRFKDHIRNADGIVISFAEHNGSYSAAYKNIFDWVSRIEMNVWGNKPMFLLATSPGGHGAKTVLSHALTNTRFTNRNTVAEFSLPSFRNNFDKEMGIVDPQLLQEFNSQLKSFEESWS